MAKLETIGPIRNSISLIDTLFEEDKNYQFQYTAAEKETSVQGGEQVCDFLRCAVSFSNVAEQNTKRVHAAIDYEAYKLFRIHKK